MSEISAETYGEVVYYAERRAMHVGLTASGWNRTGGYRTALAINARMPGSNRLILINIAPAPGTMVTQEIAPLHATYDLFLPDSVMELIITDADGDHKVPIQPGEIFMPPRVPDTALTLR